MILAMTPEEKSLLERTAALADENNRILRSMQRTQRVTTVMHVLYWVVIIGFSVGAFYFFQPYLTFLTGLASPTSSGQQGSSTLDTLMNSLKQAQSSAGSLQDLLK